MPEQGSWRRCLALLGLSWVSTGTLGFLHVHPPLCSSRGCVGPQSQVQATFYLREPRTTQNQQCRLAETSTSLDSVGEAEGELRNSSALAVEARDDMRTGYVRETPFPISDDLKIFNHPGAEVTREYSLEELLELIDQATEWLKGTGCATAVHRLSLAALSQRSDVRRLVTNDARFRRLVDRIHLLLPTLTPRSYSMILYDFGRLEFNPGKAFLETCRNSIQPKLDTSFDPRCLSNLIMGFVKIPYNPGVPFLRDFAEVAMDQLMDFAPVGLMSIIHSFAKMNFHPGEAFLKVFTACAKRRLVDFSPRELSSTLQGLATLRYLPNEEFMCLYLECIERKLDKFSWLDLPNCMTALSKLLYVPSDTFMRKFVQRTEEELHSFNPQALSNFIFGLFKLRFDPGPVFMEKYFSVCLTRLDRFTPPGFSSMLHSVARMGYYPGEVFLEQLELYATPKLHQFTRAEIWKIIHGLASINYRPAEPFMAGFWRSVARDTASLSVKDTSLILWSLAVLDVGHMFVDSLAELVEVTGDLVERHRLDPQNNEYSSRRSGDEPAVVKYRQLMQALAYLETLPDPRLKIASERLSLVLADAWRARGGGLGDHMRAMPSFYTFVMSLFQRLGAVVNSGVLKDAFNLEIMLFPWSESGQAVAGQRPVVFLLEGRGHYFTNRPTQLTGDATFRYDMVKGLAADRFTEVVRLTVWDWKNAKGRDGKVALIRGLLAEKGLDLKDYLPPREGDGPREGEGGEEDDWDLGAGEEDGDVGGFSELERDWEEEQDEKKRMDVVMEGMRRRGAGDGEGKGAVDEPPTLKPRKKRGRKPASPPQEPKPPSRPSLADRPL